VSSAQISAVLDLDATEPAERDHCVGPSVIDMAATQQAVRLLLLALGQDPDAEHLIETPRRVAESFEEFLSHEPVDLTTFPNDEDYHELVLARGIPFSSLCEHHLLPFHGVAHVGYVPAARLVGLSKLARIVDVFSRRLQLQERLTAQVADWLEDQLHPEAVAVVIEADHLCMSLRGIRATGALTVTSAVHGLFRDDPRARQEFLALARGPSSVA
jgi:GTP cyclohydrolase IA